MQINSIKSIDNGHPIDTVNLLWTLPTRQRLHMAVNPQQSLIVLIEISGRWGPLTSDLARQDRQVEGLKAHPKVCEPSLH